MVVEIPAPRVARQVTIGPPQVTSLAETPGRSEAERPPASLPKAAALDRPRDARSATLALRRVAVTPPTAVALFEARLKRSQLCSPERLYENMPYLDTESDLSESDSLMNWEAQRDSMAEIKIKVRRVLPAELRPFKRVLAKAGATDTVTLKRIIEPGQVKGFVNELSEVNIRTISVRNENLTRSVTSGLPRRAEHVRVTL